MKTTEQINQIKTLKAYIAELVDAHKSTKKIARMSSNAEGFSYSATGRAQWKYSDESEELFVLYTVYYILRHNVENIEEYAENLFRTLKPWKQEKHFGFVTFGMSNSVLSYPSYQSTGKTFADTLKITIQFLDKYVDSKEQSNE